MCSAMLVQKEEKRTKNHLWRLYTMRPKGLLKAHVKGEKELSTRVYLSINQHKIKAFK